MVCLTFPKADQKSFSMASLNSSHDQDLAIVLWKPHSFGPPCTNICCFRSPPRKPSPDGFLLQPVYQQVLWLRPPQAPLTFKPQLLEATSAREAMNMSHSDSMSLTYSGTCEKCSRRSELKVAWTKGFKRCSQVTLTMHLD